MARRLEWYKLEMQRSLEQYIHLEEYKWEMQRSLGREIERRSQWY
jgi:hypothetical protein